MLTDDEVLSMAEAMIARLSHIIAKNDIERLREFLKEQASEIRMYL